MRSERLAWPKQPNASLIPQSNKKIHALGTTIVIMVSPSVQALFQLECLARHDLADYGVQLVEADTAQPEKWLCTRGEKGWARPIPAVRQIERVGGKERKRRGRQQQHLESGGAPPPSSHRCSFHSAYSRLLLLHGL